MLPLLVGLGASATLMAALWIVGLRTKNMSIVDPGWAAAIGLCGAIDAALSGAPDARRTLIALMAIGWAARLAIHLVTDRIVGHPEEGRYVELRRRWAPRANAAFFLFFQAQAALAALLSVPFWLAARHDAPLGPIEAAAAGLLVAAVAGEAIADRQLQRFKRRPDSRGRTCREGLWAWSRHPNYFFEWLVWIAFALLALPAPHGWVALGAPALMLYLLFRVTGIPATEAQAIRSRGDDYRAYQRETSAFFPMPPRRSA